MDVTVGNNFIQTVCMVVARFRESGGSYCASSCLIMVDVRAGFAGFVYFLILIVPNFPLLAALGNVRHRLITLGGGFVAGETVATPPRE